MTKVEAALPRSDALRIVREAVEYALLQAEATFDPLIRDGHAEGKAGHRRMVKAGIAGTPSLLTLRLRDALVALPPPDAILIDPTAPETVAALAAALIDRGFLEWFNGGIEFPETAPEMATAILPAFIARLRGEP